MKSHPAFFSRHCAPRNQLLAVFLRSAGALLFLAVHLVCALPAAGADADAPPAPPASAQQQSVLNTQAAAAVAMGHDPVIPDFIERMADSLLELFDIQSTGNSWQRYLLAAAVIAMFYLFRRLILPLFFRGLRKLTSRTSWTLDEKLLAACETPAAMFVMIAGVYVALRTLRHPVHVDQMLRTAAILLFAVTLLWLIVRLINALFDYALEKARENESAVVNFMPWIRKTVVSIFVVIGVLLIAQNFGLNVQAFLAGLGIGGLAFALAAQDTIANIFGAAVVAIDQPFKLGDVVQLAGHTGTVEDIGIRSMKLRRPDKALVVIPNKTVASESIVNLSKFSNRRVEQVLGFTYDSTPEQLAAIVDDIRALIAAEPDALPASGMVYFRDFNASSLDLWIVYLTKEPDFAKHMALRQRLNLAFMRAAVARGLSFAFPTQTIDLAPSAAKALGSRKE